MSESHGEHESPIRTPKQLIVTIVAAFLVPIVLLVLLAQYFTSGKQEGAGSQAQSPEAIAARIRPVADEGFTFKSASGPKQLQAGVEVYKACAACHASGAAGSPKFADAAAWSARIAQGYDTLVSHAINGIRGMPAKGGNPDLDDLEVARAVVHMANAAGAKFKEPEAKPAATAASASASAESPAGAASAGAAAAPAASTAPASASK
jgi:cytochrome c5